MLFLHCFVLFCTVLVLFCTVFVLFYAVFVLNMRDWIGAEQGAVRAGKARGGAAYPGGSHSEPDA